MTYDNDSDTNTGSTKYDQNMKGAHKDTDAETMYKMTDMMTL